MRQRGLARFRPADTFEFSYACTCSQLRTGEFSGGAYFVTASEIKHLSTLDWLDEQRKAWENQASDPIIVNPP